MFQLFGEEDDSRKRCNPNSCSPHVCGSDPASDDRGDRSIRNSKRYSAGILAVISIGSGRELEINLGRSSTRISFRVRRGYSGGNVLRIDSRRFTRAVQFYPVPHRLGRRNHPKSFHSTRDGDRPCRRLDSLLFCISDRRTTVFDRPPEGFRLYQDTANRVEDELAHLRLPYDFRGRQSCGGRLEYDQHQGRITPSGARGIRISDFSLSEVTAAATSCPPFPPPARNPSSDPECSGAG